jgi:hypothetical protein
MEAQIRELTSHARSLLGSRLPGPDAQAFIDREMNTLEKAWIASLDSYFGAFIDRPLSEEESAAVRKDLEARVAGFSPVTLTRNDVENEGRLDSLGILNLVSDLTEGLWGASRHVYREYAEFSRRGREWISRVESATDQVLAGLKVPEAPPPIFPEFEALEEDRKAASPARSETPEAGTPSTPAEIGSASFEKRQARSGRPAWPLGAVLGAAVIAVATWILGRRRIRFGERKS